jgi:hypothetical protein
MNNKQFINSLTEDELKIIKTITYDYNNINIVGSFKDEKIKFWSDIDVREDIYIDVTKSKYDYYNDELKNIYIQNTISEILTDIIYKINENKNYFITEIKFGTNLFIHDPFYYGYIDTDDNILYDFNIKNMKKRLKFLIKNNIFNKQQYNTIIKILNSKVKNEKKYELINDFMINKLPYIKKIDKYSPLYIGYIMNGIIYDYDYNKIKNNIYYLFNIASSINKKQYDDLNLLIKKNINIKDWEALGEYIRNLDILKWTPKELFDGKKYYGKDDFYEISKSIAAEASYNNIIKIDIIAEIDNRFLEISNYISIYVKKKPKQKFYIWNTDKIDFENEIKEDIEKLFYSEFHYKPFKGIKRMYSLAKFKKYEDDIILFEKFLDSDYGLISQIISNIDTIILLINTQNNEFLPWQNIFNNIDQFKQNIYHISDVKIDKLKIFKTIDKIIKNKNKNSLPELLNSIKFYLQDILNINSINFIQNNFNVFPDRYLPINRKYKIENLKDIKILGGYSGGYSLNEFISDLPFELHMIDFSQWLPRRYSFCGPGSKLKERLNSDDTPKPWSEPINKLDKGCYYHDLAYRNNNDLLTRNEADKKLQNVADDIILDSKNISKSELFNSYLVQKIMDYKVKNKV